MSEQKFCKFCDGRDRLCIFCYSASELIAGNTISMREFELYNAIMVYRPDITAPEECWADAGLPGLSLEEKVEWERKIHIQSKGRFFKHRLDAKTGLCRICGAAYDYYEDDYQDKWN